MLGVWASCFVSAGEPRGIIGSAYVQEEEVEGGREGGWGGEKGSEKKMLAEEEGRGGGREGEAGEEESLQYDEE